MLDRDGALRWGAYGRDVQYGLQIGATEYDRVTSWASWAESHDFVAFGVPDHFMQSLGGPAQPALDALAVVAGLARDTESIELVLLVSPVTWRHPAVLAKTYATVDQMSGGRLTMGVGTGWMEQEHESFGIPFPPLGERFGMLEEGLQYLRAAFSEPPESFDGSHYSFEAFDMHPRPDLRLLVGGTGAERTPRLAGRFANEFNAYPAPPEDFAAKVELARASAVEAGRDPDALLISTSGVLVAGETQEEFREKLERAAEVLGSPADELEESLRRRNAPCGTWDEVRATIAGLKAVGLQRFWIQSITQLGETPADLEAALDHLRG